MAFSFADRLLDSIDNIRRGVRGWLKTDHSQYFPIACAHNKNVLALHNGSLMSVIRINGYMGQYIPDQFVALREEWATFCRTNADDKRAKGFDLFWSYEFDPEGMQEFTREAKQSMIRAGERRQLDNRDIQEEEAELYGQLCAQEKQLLFIVTHIDSLPKSDHKAVRKASLLDRSTRPKGAGSANGGIGLRALDAVHEQHVDKISVFMQEKGFGYSFERLDSYESLFAMREGLIPAQTKKGWWPKLTLKDTRFRHTEDVSATSRKETKPGNAIPDWSFMMPKPVVDQLMPDGILDLGNFVVVGDRTYAPMFVDELATSPQPLDTILRMFYQRRLPVRIVYSLMANSNQANYWNRLFASMFTFMSASNRQINGADKAMKQYQETQNGAVFGFGISVVTWAKTEISYNLHGEAQIGVENIRKRANDVETLLQQWGGQQLGTVFGCAVEATLSATPGYIIPPAAPMAPQIEYDVLTQLPLMRPAKLWSAMNSIWMRTSDGILSPYQPMSSLQSTMLSLVMGGMGYGKSNLISEHNTYFAMDPEAEEMAYIRGMDFGASSLGSVDMIKASLPANRKHEAIFEYFSDTGSLIKNLLDTRVGCRYPLADHKAFLKNWLLILCDDIVVRLGVQNVSAVLDAAIDRAYKDRDDRYAANTIPLYRHDVALPEVRHAVDRYSIEFDAYTNYREIVDSLIQVGLAQQDDSVIHAAKLAQRRCTPMLSDLVLAASGLRDEFKDAPSLDGVHVTGAIANALTNANKMFKCFSGETNTDISESRVCVFDMSNVFGRGTGPGADWNRSVYFAAALRLLTEDLFVSARETGQEMRLKLKELGLTEELLAWHINYLERQDQVKKVFWADEVHRIGKVGGALSILDAMALEGRKYVVGIMLGTQMPGHFPPDMLKLATSIFIFGASQSAQNAKEIQDLFDLTDDERYIIERITKPNPRKGAEVFVIHKVDTRTQRLKLHFNIGRIKLWAYATGGSERRLRQILYKRGPSTTWARRTLADKVPDLDQVLKHRKGLVENQDLSESEIVDGLAEELLAVKI